jgi:CHRD domain
MKVETAIALSIFSLAGTQLAFADGRSNRLSADLEGFNEPPAISTTANGEFKARLDAQGQEITWRLEYNDTEGTVTQAHIHIGQKDVNGGISVFLCTNLGNGPVGTQPCPPAPATISGTIRPADVSPPIPATAAAIAQGVATGEFAELVRAIRAGVTYVNVHSTKFPGGEMRDQIRGGHGH